MAKHFTKSIFNTIIQAFYKEIRDNKGKLGEPNVVIYRYDKPDFTFNPRKDTKQANAVAKTHCSGLTSRAFSCMIESLTNCRGLVQNRQVKTHDHCSGHFQALCSLGAQPERKKNGCQKPCRTAAEPFSCFRS